MARPVSMHLLLALSTLCLPTFARAQTYNVGGTPSMITPDGSVFDDARAPGTGAIAPSQAAELQERFDIDCDPDIEVCVDPNAEAAAYDDGYDPNAYQQFQSALAPYGQWNEDPNFGQVWIPSVEVVGDGFEPYATEGQWTASSDYGYTWVSDYDWGWAPFHYGRWTVIDGLGWGWIPGTLWGPSWVDWRYGNGYCGWSPSAPRGVVVPPPGRRGSRGARAQWHFTLASDLTRRNPSYVPDTVARGIFARTSSINNARTISTNGVTTRINLGPPVASVSRDIGRAVPTLALKNGAPSQLPRAAIIPHEGMALTQRNYARSSVAVTRPPTRAALTGPSPQRMNAPPSYPLGNTYSAPAQPAYRGSYQAPQRSYQAPSYSQPAYQAPQRSYQAPAYSQPAYQAPQRSYQAPAYSQPAYQAPVSQPSYARPSYYQPAPSVSRPSAPAPMSRPSAPSFSTPSFGPHRR